MNDRSVNLLTLLRGYGGVKTGLEIRLNFPDHGGTITVARRFVPG
jgi:hypothetical protein